MCRVDEREPARTVTDAERRALPLVRRRSHPLRLSSISDAGRAPRAHPLRSPVEAPPPLRLDNGIGHGSPSTGKALPRPQTGPLGPYW